MNPSPYRNPDGSLTADGVAGKALFDKLGCDFCHGGPDFTDSARGLLHDVGTITPLSGKRAGGPLFGFDTPTLLGVWETAPYLHDGSAPTLRDVLTTRNPNDLHGYVSSLSSHEVDQLVAYLEQIDNELPVQRLPFDPRPDGRGARAAGRRGRRARLHGAAHHRRLRVRARCAGAGRGPGIAALIHSRRRALRARRGGAGLVARRRGAAAALALLAALLAGCRFRPAGRCAAADRLVQAAGG